MPRPRLMLPPAVLLLACLAVLPACNKDKKKSADTNPEPAPVAGPEPGPGSAPTVGTDHVLFARLDAKAVRDSALFAEVKQAFTRAGGAAEWDQVERDAGKDLGVKPTELDAVTVCVTELPPRGDPKFVVILSAARPIDKAAVFRLGPTAKPDARGFYALRKEGLVHFPDDRTAVLLHPDLAQKYLDGYGRTRTGWPLSADLTRAAGGHTLFATVNVDRLPTGELRGPDAKAFEPLLAARTVTLTADLKGKELAAAVRASFPDAAAAQKARDTVKGFVGQAAAAVDQLAGGKLPGSVGPAVQEARRALTDAKVEASGSDVTVAASYRANFDIPAVVGDGVVKVREAAARAKGQNYLKQVGIALHNYHDANGRLPVHGVGKNGVALKAAAEKPLLSWRVAILPYIEQGPLYNQFKLDEPWDSPANKKLIAQMPVLYAPTSRPGKPGYTHLQMVVGPGAMQPVGVPITGITDGTSNTIAVAEAAEPVIWTKPDDVMLPGQGPPKDLKKKFGGLFPGGFNVLMWDGSVRFVRDTVSERTLGLLVNPRDGQPIPSDW